MVKERSHLRPNSAFLENDGELAHWFRGFLYEMRDRAGLKALVDACHAQGLAVMPLPDQERS